MWGFQEMLKYFLKKEITYLELEKKVLKFCLKKQAMLNILKELLFLFSLLVNFISHTKNFLKSN